MATRRTAADESAVLDHARAPGVGAPPAADEGAGRTTVGPGLAPWAGACPDRAVGRGAGAAPQRGGDLRPGAGRASARPPRGAGRGCRSRGPAGRPRPAGARGRGGRAPGREPRAPRSHGGRRTPRGRGRELRRAGPRAGRALSLARRAPPGHTPGRSPRRSRVDPLRPPHAHVLVDGLPGRAGRARGPRARRGTRVDRGHGPQRVRRRARGDRGGERNRALRHPGRGGEDGRPGRGHRPLPRARDSARTVLRGHDRRDQGAGRRRLPSTSFRPDALDSRCEDDPPAPGRDRRLRGLQRPAPLRAVQRRGASLRPEVQPHDGRGLRRTRRPRGRHRRSQNAGVPGQGRVPRQPADGGDPAPAALPGLPPGAQVDRPGQGESLGRQNLNHADRACDRRDPRALSAEGDRRDERARRRDPAVRRGPCSGDRLGAPARRDLPAEVPPAALRAAGRSGVLRPGGPGAAEVAEPIGDRSARRLRDELLQVRRRRRAAGGGVAAPGAPHRPAEACRRHGRGGACVPERARVSAFVRARGKGGRGAAMDADRGRAVCPRHRRLAGRAGGEDPFLAGPEGARAVVGRAPAVLIRDVATPRVAAFCVLVAALAAYYAGHDELVDLSKWWDLAFLALCLIPAIVALIIPWIDAVSVWRGPTGHIVEEEPGLFDRVAFDFPHPGEASSAQLGPPDLLFFALFLAAAARWNLRVGWTFVALTLSLGLTMVIGVVWESAGLPALPGLAFGFLIPNADLLWRELQAWRRDRREPAGSSA